MRRNLARVEDISAVSGPAFLSAERVGDAGGVSMYSGTTGTFWTDVSAVRFATRTTSSDWERHTGSLAILEVRDKCAM